MEIKGPAAVYGRKNEQWDTSAPLATWQQASLSVPKQMANGRAIRWNPGTVVLAGFRAGSKNNHTEIFEEETHALARIDDVAANRSCFIVLKLNSYASPGHDQLLLHTQGPPITGPIGGQAAEEPLNP